MFPPWFFCRPVVVIHVAFFVIQSGGVRLALRFVQAEKFDLFQRIVELTHRLSLFCGGL